MLVLSAAALTYTASAILVKQHLSLPIAGSGLVFFTSALLLVCAGAVAELIYRLGDLREVEFSALTQNVQVRRASAALRKMS